MRAASTQKNYNKQRGFSLYFGRGGRENQRQLTKSSLKFSKSPNSGLEYYELNREAPRGVFSTKNHQGGLDGSDDPSDGKMFESKGLAHCPVTVVKAYLSYLNPKCEALFQKPLSGAKFNPSSTVIWYSTVLLGHNTIVRTSWCQPSVYQSPCYILSSRNMKNHHIRAVTGHKSDASLESYNDRSTFEHFQDMSSAITEFVNLSKPQVALRPGIATSEFRRFGSRIKAVLFSLTPPQDSHSPRKHPVFYAVLQTWYNFWWILRQLLFQLSFQVNFKNFDWMMTIFCKHAFHSHWFERCLRTIILDCHEVFSKINYRFSACSKIL